MYQLDNNYVNVSVYDIYLALEYFEKNNIEDTILKKHLEQCIDEFEFNECEYVKIKNNEPIIRFILDVYKSELNLQMIQNSLFWAIINIDTSKKFKLEFLYKVFISKKLKMLNIWDDKLENDVLLDLLKDNCELYSYIIFTQNIDDYMEDVECKEQIEQKLAKYLKNR